MYVERFILESFFISWYKFLVLMGKHHWKKKGQKAQSIEMKH